MEIPQDDGELCALVQEKLYTAVVADVLDSLGFRNQAFRHDVRPVYAGATVVGRAYTVLNVDIFEVRPDPYKEEIAAVDALLPNDVMVVSTGPSTRTCFWGELLSTAAMARGARGAIVDGFVRDARQIEAMRFPVFATGFRPLDSAGRSMVADRACTIVAGDVTVRHRDLVFADVDGIVAIPREVEREALRRAFEKVSSENLVRDALREGMLLRDAFDRYGVL